MAIMRTGLNSQHGYVVNCSKRLGGGDKMNSLREKVIMPWQIIQQVIEEQREIDCEMKRMEQIFEEEWNKYGDKR